MLVSYRGLFFSSLQRRSHRARYRDSSPAAVIFFLVLSFYTRSCSYRSSNVTSDGNYMVTGRIWVQWTLPVEDKLPLFFQTRDTLREVLFWTHKNSPVHNKRLKGTWVNVSAMAQSSTTLQAPNIVQSSVLDSLIIYPWILGVCWKLFTLRFLLKFCNFCVF